MEGVTVPVVSTTLEAGRACSTCGFDPAQLSPADASVAARSLARRWRELLTRVEELEDGEALLRRRLIGGSSPLELAGHVGDEFSRTADLLERVWAQDQPVLDEPKATSATADSSSVGDQVTALAAAAERLAHSIERYGPDHWDRTGVGAGRPVSALELARGTIHGGVHHLRTCGRSLAAACGRPVDIDEDDER